MRAAKHLALVGVLALPAIAAGETVITVGTSGQLAVALGTVPDGGVIELLPGSYTGGFVVTNPARRFTLRATPGSAFLDGGGNQPVFKYTVTNPYSRGWIAFEGLNFQNGYSYAPNSQSGGVTLIGGRATFVDCVFANNVSAAPSGQVGGGGGVGLITGSKAMFIRCLWSGNTSKSEGGGMLVIGQSVAFIHDSQFIGNRTNVPGHKPVSGGGAINVWNSTLRITNTRFEGNEAGFTGGAIDAASLWSDVGTDVIASNCTFVGNVAQPDPSVNPPSPTEGGAVEAENLATVRLYNCRLEHNRSQVGGAIGTYRGIVEVSSSLLRGNVAVGDGTIGGWGGAIYAGSLDTVSDGTSNRRPAAVAIRNSLVQGRYGDVGAGAEAGGCVLMQGDTNRMYGQGGVSQMGSLADNRAILDITGSVLYDCDSAGVVSTGSSGGGVYVGLTDIAADSSSFLENDATGTNAWGGAIGALGESAVSATTSAFAGNSATLQGGAMQVLGSTLTVNSCAFIGNEISPGVSEPEAYSLGAAVVSGPQDWGGIVKSGTGIVENSLFSGDAGLPVWDDDRSGSSAYNAVQYNGNVFYNMAFGGRVYLNFLVGAAGHTPAQLNSLVVSHSGGVAVDKSPLGNNSSSAVPPGYGSLLAVPPARLAHTASGDSSTTTESFLAYAWSGSSASLDGSNLGAHDGVTAASVGAHSLVVGTQSFPVNVSWGASPAATLLASPNVISAGQSSTLEWSTIAGTPLDSMVDWEVDTAGAPAGAVSVTPAGTRTYRLLVATKEGGALATETIYVDEVPQGEVFADGFESGSPSAWSLTVP